MRKKETRLYVAEIQTANGIAVGAFACFGLHGLCSCAQYYRQHFRFANHSCRANTNRTCFRSCKYRHNTCRNTIRYNYSTGNGFRHHSTASGNDGSSCHNSHGNDVARSNHPSCRCTYGYNAVHNCTCCDAASGIYLGKHNDTSCGNGASSNHSSHNRTSHNSIRLCAPIDRYSGRCAYLHYSRKNGR